MTESDGLLRAQAFEAYEAIPSLDAHGELTRLSDGAVATRSYDRQRTDTGSVSSGSTTNFQGQTRGFGFERTRTARGYRGEGTATGYDGQSYELRSAGRRGPNGGVVRRQSVRDGEGELVAGRRVAVRRSEAGGVSRRVHRFGGPRPSDLSRKQSR